MKAKTIFTSFILAVLISATASCSGDDNPPIREETTKITLSADKQTIQADGKDAVKFTVFDETGNEVNTKCNLYINDKAVTSFTFTTAEPGTYKVHAVLKGSETKSGEVSVVALDPNVETIDNLFINADKNRVLADNADMATLSVVDAEGTDVTSSVVFYANGQKLNGRYLKASGQSVLTVTATLEGKKLKNELQISAFNTVTFKHRLYIEQFTGTWCQYCHIIIEFLDPILKENKDMFLAVLHQNDALSGNFESTATTPLFKQWNGRTPSVIINRTDLFGAEIESKGASYLKGYIKREAAAGLGIENSLKDNKLSATVHVRAKENMKGKLIVVLTEDGFKANQINMGMITHNDVMRNYFPGVTGGEEQNFSSTATTSVPFEILLNENGVKDINNCHVTAFLLNEEGKVVNVQRTRATQNIGY